MSAAVDVVILTWNDGDLLDKAVRSALTSEGVDVRVIVVDNGSEPPASPPVDDRVLLIRNDANRGVAPARNQGVAAGDAPYICLLDSDAALHPGALRALLDAASDERVALAAPVFSGQSPEASAGRAPSLIDKGMRVLNFRSDYRTVTHGGPAWDVDFAIGACQFIRRGAWEEVGGLDESYFYGPEDVDFCLRLREAGWRVMQTSAAGCDHPPRRRFRGLLTRRGLAHAKAVTRHLWRHRNFHRHVAVHRVVHQ